MIKVITSNELDNNRKLLAEKISKKINHPELTEIIKSVLEDEFIQC